MDSYKIFTIESGVVTQGARIDTLVLSGAGTSIPAIIVGESGRGRSRGVLPIGNPPMIDCPDRYVKYLDGPETISHTVGNPGLKPETLKKCPHCGTLYTPWELYTFRNDAGGGSGWRSFHPQTGKVYGKLLFAEIGQTNSQKPKLWATKEATNKTHAILVLRTPIGYRGSNGHTGDRNLEICVIREQYRKEIEAIVSGKIPNWNFTEAYNRISMDRKDELLRAGIPEDSFESKLIFSSWPGKAIVDGIIAQGDAGAMGSGKQLICLMPKDVVFRTYYEGRLYGREPEHYYVFDGETVISATQQERVASDIF